MKPTTTFLAALIAVAVFVFSCKKSTNTTNANGDIYLAGTMAGGFPAYWKNGTITQLNSTFKGWGRAIYVDGNDVYVAGELTKHQPIDTSLTRRCPILWKNNTPIIMSDSAGAIFDVKVVNGSVYAAGFL